MNKIYAIEAKAPRGKRWSLWDLGPFSTNKEAVKKSGEEWWGKEGHGRSGFKYRVATFKRVKS